MNVSVYAFLAQSINFLSSLKHVGLWHKRWNFIQSLFPRSALHRLPPGVQICRSLTSRSFQKFEPFDWQLDSFKKGQQSVINCYKNSGNGQGSTVCVRHRESLFFGGKSNKSALRSINVFYVGLSSWGSDTNILCNMKRDCKGLHMATQKIVRSWKARMSQIRLKTSIRLGNKIQAIGLSRGSEFWSKANFHRRLVFRTAIQTNTKTLW